MTQIAPPADLTRSERKSFRNLARTVEQRGIDPIARASLIAEVVRLEARLLNLREAEKQAEAGSKLAAARAVTTATSELRRLGADLFRGARQPAPVRPTIEAQAEAEHDEGVEAWRRFYWHSDHTFSRAELDRRYGPAGWGSLLYASPEEQISAERMFAEFPSPRRLPSGQLAEHHRRFPKGPRVEPS